MASGGFLGTDYIISSTIWMIICFGFLYVFRKKIFKFYYKDIDFDHFIVRVQEYLTLHHPKIKFDYSIIEKTAQEPNHTARCYEVIDRLIMQFIDAQIDTNVDHKPLPQSQLWDSYTFNSKPIGTKLPSDWAQRKLATCQRDDNICQRCGFKTKPEFAHLFLLKSIKEGGQFYLENLAIVCKDCHKIMTKKDLKYLDIRDNLTSFIQ